MIVNPARTPPNGWHFPVTPSITLRGHDKQSLIDAVYEWRLRQNLPLDRIEREVDDYYCTTWPSACNKEPSDYGLPPTTPTQPSAQRVSSLLHRVSRWAAGLAEKMPRGGYPLVTAEEAARRQSICAACPQNRPWRTGCKGCSGSAMQLMMQIRGLRKGRGDNYGCWVAGWDNVTSSHLPLDVLPLSDATLNQLDQRCWRRPAPQA